MIKFGVGVIVYNPDDSVFERLMEYAKITKYLIIFDNSDKINSVSEKISSNFSSYYFHIDNIGMSGALNKIFKVSIELGLDILLTMDQDSDFSNDSILRTLKIMRNKIEPDVAIYCPNYRKIYLDETSGEEVQSKCKIDRNRIVTVDYAMTSGSFYRVETLGQLLPLDNLFIGYVDQDICYSLRIKQYTIKMIGEVIFDQRVGEKVSNSFINRIFRTIYQGKERYFYMFRNNLYLQNKYKDHREIKSSLIKNLIRISINLLLFEKNKLKKIKYSIYGVRASNREEMGKLVNKEK